MTKLIASTLTIALALVGCSRGAPPPLPSSASLASAELSEHDRALLRDPAVVRGVLAAAARDDDAETVHSLARHGIDVDTPLGEGRTALTLAAYHRSDRAARALLDAHADPEGKEAALSPLMHAAFVGDDVIVSDLVLAGARVDRTTPYGQTPLMFAALFGRQSTYDTLVRLGADENVTDGAGVTAKALKAYANDADAVERFLRSASAKLGDFARATR
jgi:uncharacterized protein